VMENSVGSKAAGQSGCRLIQPCNGAICRILAEPP
jgi:hypothetical protein